VFNALGLEDVHGAMSKFYVFVSHANNAHVSRNFIACTVQWVVLHNEDPDSGHVRLRKSKELRDTFTTLHTVKTCDAGFEAPEWDFVQKDVWDAGKDGPYDPSKVTTQSIFGDHKEGIWIRRGRAGVFKWKAREMTGTVESTLEDNGTGPFAEERLQTKMGVVN
jgi:hypothetical protein